MMLYTSWKLRVWESPRRCRSEVITSGLFSVRKCNGGEELAGGYWAWGMGLGWRMGGGGGNIIIIIIAITYLEARIVSCSREHRDCRRSCLAYLMSLPFWLSLGVTKVWLLEIVTMIRGSKLWEI